MAERVVFYVPAGALFINGVVDEGDDAKHRINVR